MKTLLAILCAGMVGCSTMPREKYIIKDLTVVLDTQQNVNKAYQLFTAGHRRGDVVAGFQVGNMIYCRHDDDTTLGHELRHVLEGKYHK